MMKNSYRGTQGLIARLAVVAIFLVPFSAFAQTKISYHSNKFKESDDVKLGRQAAQEAEQQLPVMRDQLATDYVSRVGQRLVGAIPQEFQHQEFQYYFKIINASDINAFALPGGPMYVNRGMIEAARSEGEMAGVMAHELSHVALRHGTAQATKAQKYALLAGVLGIGGAILGGPAGAAAQLGQAGVGVYFMKFSREYETEADVLGAQIMARAGYDPRDLANMFKTIERQSGGGGGGFFSDHPSPENRYARINQEADYLKVENPIRYSRDFERVQARLHTYPRAATTAEILQSGQRYPAGDNTGRNPDNQGRYPDNNDRRNPGSGSIGRVPAPSSRYRQYTEFNVLRVSVPDNWREIADNNSVWFAPEGAYGQVQGQPVFTHGVNLGVAGTQNRDLQSATDELVNSLMQGNRSLRQSSGYNRINSGGRNWITTTFSNINEATGRSERIALFTAQFRTGELFYLITVAPQSDAGAFQNAFDNIIRSLQINDR